MSEDSIDPSWVQINEYDDCKFKITENGGLEIHSANRRNLVNVDLTAPRIIRKIWCDFSVVVNVSYISDEKPQIGGLLVWKDKDTYLRFDTSSISEHEFSLHGWLNMIWQISGRGYLEKTQDGSVYLRLERSGNQISAYCSGDGKNWFTCGNLEFPSGDPIQVGIYAIGFIDRTIYCGSYKDGTATLFRNFRIWTK